MEAKKIRFLKQAIPNYGFSYNFLPWNQPLLFIKVGYKFK